MALPRPGAERAALALALLGCGILAALASATPPEVPTAEVAAHVGQEVAVSGYVRDVQATSQGSRFLLAAEGHGVVVHADNAAPEAGSFVRVEGRLSALGGTVRLHGQRLQVVQEPAATFVSLDTIAADPIQYTDRPLVIHATPGPDVLEWKGIRVAADGLPQTSDALHVLAGELQYLAQCTCYVFHVHEAEPWKP